MITRVHTSSESHTWNWPSFSGSSSTIRPTAPDMMPCDYHAFSPLKAHLEGKRFNSDYELKDPVKDWVSSPPQEIWKQGILQLVYQWDRFFSDLWYIL
ncbi:hypothetical protein TNIN_108461 [Trichonephila inaurata madagascariensis]|uniref:Uncharacterized protein n=1 Tax=Trichonephila inaurata madagascariensis TaxID=2747483 RepID=A0A8X6YDN3_9ARAC|nr:hypothetical protein TNIN_108461 [Trichonephila inaurata madagascariensis]